MLLSLKGLFSYLHLRKSLSRPRIFVSQMKMVRNSRLASALIKTFSEDSSRRFLDAFGNWAIVGGT
uniref:Uncharacterized protein n=1 Tax=Cannabis sativa TaxID=3483 RepID=A0A803QVK2_CANSA